MAGLRAAACGDLAGLGAAIDLLQRRAQGVFGAMLAPSALALLATTFTDPRERGKAFGIFGAIAGSGAAIGLLLGGALTEYASWRWCLYVNLLFAVPAALAALPIAVWEFSLGVYLTVRGFRPPPEGSR